MPTRISPPELIALIATDHCPLVVDVRRREVFGAASKRIAGSVWRDHTKTEEWAPLLQPGQAVAVYCLHGHNVSELAVARLAALGIQASMLEGGIEAFAAAGGPMVAAHVEGVPKSPSVWVTRERPKIDRLACPWLVRRFIDPFAVFHFADAWVVSVAEELSANPYDVKGVKFSHRGAACTFGTLLEEFVLVDPALHHLARIVRGADTARLDLEPQAAGLLALSLGLSAIEADDLRQLEKGMVLYDALYAWVRHARTETHNWPVAAVTA